MSLRAVAEQLRNALLSPKESTVKRFIEWCLQRFVNKSNLQEAIDNKVDVLTLALNHHGLGHSRLTPLFKGVLRMYWSEVEEYLTDVALVRRTLSEDQECAEILRSQGGIAYLNWCCRTSYDGLYDFLWK